MFLGLFILSWLSITFAQDFTTSIDLKGAVAIYNEKGACTTRAESALCGSLPWAPRLHEGAVAVGGAVFILMDADLPPDTQIARWSKRFSASTRAELTSYFMVNNPTFGAALTVSPFTVAYLVLIKKVANSYRIVSVGMNISSQILSEVNAGFNVVQGELEEARTEWIPPPEFKMGHQFKLNDAI